jgi:hypothetical protein
MGFSQDSGPNCLGVRVAASARPKWKGKGNDLSPQTRAGASPARRVCWLSGHVLQRRAGVCCCGGGGDFGPHATRCEFLQPTRATPRSHSHPRRHSGCLNHADRRRLPHRPTDLLAAGRNGTTPANARRRVVSLARPALSSHQHDLDWCFCPARDAATLYDSAVPDRWCSDARHDGQRTLASARQNGRTSSELNVARKAWSDLKGEAP